MFKHVCFLAVLATCPLFADAKNMAQPQPQGCPISIKDMNDDQKRVTGMDKLTDDEKEALDAWFCEQWNMQQKAVMQSEPLTNQKMAPTGSEVMTITEIQDNGRRLLLSDGSLYTIVGAGIKKTAKWIQSDRIRVVTTKKPAVFKLKNLTQDQAARARRNISE